MNVVLSYPADLTQARIVVGLQIFAEDNRHIISDGLRSQSRATACLRARPAGLLVSFLTTRNL